ncbi:MAG: alpha/beta hydrolase [Anaerolineae bacterium]|nr:alpha/beta hydrolase [Anaerolineae bacterium]
MNLKSTFRLLGLLVWVCVFGMSVAYGQQSSYRAADCPDELDLFDFSVEVAGETYQCGAVTVPQNRQTLDGRTVSLPVLTLNATGPTDQAPIVYLSGGPGGSAIAELDYWRTSPLRMFHDIILVEQRGTALTSPNLLCPEFQEGMMLPVTACAERLRADGVELAAYNTQENAADIHDLIVQMGLPPVNLIGISYGTRLGSAVLRDYPEVIRALVLDSVYPVQASVYDGRLSAAQRAIDALFAACYEDAACQPAYPDLEHDFYIWLARLNSSPASYNIPFSNRDFYFDDAVLMEFLIQWLYDTRGIPSLPETLSQLIEGDYSVFDAYFGLSGDIPAGAFIPLSDGLYLSIQCQEEIPSDDIETILRGDGRVRFEVADPLRRSLRGQFASCIEWDVPPADPNAHQPVVSDMPVLLLSGRFDPITPPEWAEAAAATLPNSQYVFFESGGHGMVNTLDCATAITMRFLREPLVELDTSCAAQKPIWSVP